MTFGLIPRRFRRGRVADAIEGRLASEYRKNVLLLTPDQIDRHLVRATNFAMFGSAPSAVQCESSKRGRR